MQKQEDKTLEVDGYSLFMDIEDRDLRIRNQAVCMRNMALAYRNRESGKVAATGLHNLMIYMGFVPDADKMEVVKQFTDHCKQDGFIPQVQESAS